MTKFVGDYLLTTDDLDDLVEVYRNGARTQRVNDVVPLVVTTPRPLSEDGALRVRERLLDQAGVHERDFTVRYVADPRLRRLIADVDVETAQVTTPGVSTLHHVTFTVDDRDQYWFLVPAGQPTSFAVRDGVVRRVADGPDADLLVLSEATSFKVTLTRSGTARFATAPAPAEGSWRIAARDASSSVTVAPGGAADPVPVRRPGGRREGGTLMDRPGFITLADEAGPCADAIAFGRRDGRVVRVPVLVLEIDGQDRDHRPVGVTLLRAATPEQAQCVRDGILAVTLATRRVNTLAGPDQPLRVPRLLEPDPGSRDALAALLDSASQPQPECVVIAVYPRYAAVTWPTPELHLLPTTADLARFDPAARAVDAIVDTGHPGAVLDSRDFALRPAGEGSVYVPSVAAVQLALEAPTARLSDVRTQFVLAVWRLLAGPGLVDEIVGGVGADSASEVDEACEALGRCAGRLGFPAARVSPVLAEVLVAPFATGAILGDSWRAQAWLDDVGAALADAYAATAAAFASGQRSRGELDVPGRYGREIESLAAELHRSRPQGKTAIRRQIDAGLAARSQRVAQAAWLRAVVLHGVLWVLLAVVLLLWASG